jgi:hypothetical protein
VTFAIDVVHILQNDGVMSTTIFMIFISNLRHFEAAYHRAVRSGQAAFR